MSIRLHVCVLWAHMNVNQCVIWEKTHNNVGNESRVIDKSYCPKSNRGKTKAVFLCHGPPVSLVYNNQSCQSHILRHLPTHTQPSEPVHLSIGNFTNKPQITHTLLSAIYKPIKTWMKIQSWGVTKQCRNKSEERDTDHRYDEKHYVYLKKNTEIFKRFLLEKEKCHSKKWNLCLGKIWTELKHFFKWN